SSLGSALPYIASDILTLALTRESACGLPPSSLANPGYIAFAASLLIFLFSSVSLDSAVILRLSPHLKQHHSLFGLATSRYQLQLRHADHVHQSPPPSAVPFRVRALGAYSLRP